MGRYVKGDVVLASVRIDAKSGAKVRPCIVVSTTDTGTLVVCPISSRPACDTATVPVSLDDFSTGGLDLFRESYILTSRQCRITCREIVGKKGRLSDEFIASNIH
ncbi:MAG TPA: type II toxin-antitoxin system PemK/MazF family toxin [Methanoregulaceae archaeon]|nr:type II toxin-antitoxin system PemK/MazF family toxin [Methanoregulaceae archaeon]